MNRNSQRGVALVITLMMLAIITIIVVVFLGLARRNRAGVSLKSSQTDAQYAAEYALQRAKADVVSRMMFTNQMLGFDIAVSVGQDRPPFPTAANTRLIDPAGTVTGGPVLVDTNTRANATPGPLDSRFYLDLNRNRIPDATTTNQTGDPEWIFVLDKLDQPYGPNNRFISRYAYVVVPSGKALDINTMHNISGPTTAGTGFLRNQGVGPWELNLAALLNEMDSNAFPYAFQTLPFPNSTGAAFSNAADLVRFRATNDNKVPFPTLAMLFTNANILTTNGIDDLGDDSPIFSSGFNLVGEPPGNANNDNILKPYPGADAMRHYFTPQDFFDETKTSPSFVQNLKYAISGTNGYKYYDLIAQLATDTGTEARRRINANYVNMGGISTSDLQSWDSDTTNAVVFFTNAAQRIFVAMSNQIILNTNVPIRSVCDIMVFPTNAYRGYMHRIMQVAANIFDATRSDPLPSVFRPILDNKPAPDGSTTNLYIVGWTNDNSANTLGAWLASNTNSVPLVIGAKKWLPNFNEYSLSSDFLVTRKLNVLRRDTNSLPHQTNQMYILGLSNTFGVEIWNSYGTPYVRSGQFSVSNTVSVTLTNQFGLQYFTNFATYAFTNFNSLPGWPGIASTQGFVLPLLTQAVTLANSVYSFRNNRFEGVGTNVFENSTMLGSPWPLPYWVATISNQVVFTHTDTATRRIVDFVALNDVSSVDLYRELIGNDPASGTAVAGVWNTNRIFGPNGPFEGMRDQIDISLGNTSTSVTDWRNWSLGLPNTNDKEQGIANFRAFYGLNTLNPSYIGTNSQTSVETPFNPVARLMHVNTWQANDPLVHYHPDDLRIYPSNRISQIIKPPKTPIYTNLPPMSLGNVNDGYSPWGNEYRKAGDVNSWNYTLRDAGVWSSDYWDFPTNKLPSVGWLGRVHRGTPWQTIYFKAEAASMGDWQRHSHDIRHHPTNDWWLAELFTTALTDTSAQGLLSVNQQRLGSWAALFGGIVVLSNSTPADQLNFGRRGDYSPLLVSNSPALVKIFSAITAARDRQPGKLFSNLGQMLAIPELTTGSPFLNRDDTTGNIDRFGIEDFAYEWIPQQILGLLRIGEPRFVVYAYGQALKPERVNTSSGGVDNYQITAEFATRTVMRVEGTANKPKVVVESFNILPPD